MSSNFLYDTYSSQESDFAPGPCHVPSFNLLPVVDSLDGFV